MSRGRCQVCAGRSGAHYGWCSIVGGPGHRHTQPEPEPAGPSWSAGLGHLEAPLSVLTVAVNCAAVVVASTAILCPDCLGDWCEACGFTGLARPTVPAPVVASVHELPVPAAPVVPVPGVVAA